MIGIRCCQFLEQKAFSLSMELISIELFSLKTTLS